MLSDSQKLTIKVAVRRAREHGAEAEEVRKLSAGMNVGEAEIRAYAEQALGAPVKASVAPAATAPAAEASNSRRGRTVWTPEQITRLMELHSQGKGPAAIARTLGCDAKRIQAKLHGLRKSGVLTAPTITPPRAPSVSVPFAEETETQKVPEAQAQPVGEPPAGNAPDSPNRAAEPAESPEYSALRAKLAEPEPSGINLAKELLNLMDHFELAYNAKPVLLQASPSAGWAACSFDAAGRRYSVSLRKKRREAES